MNFVARRRTPCSMSRMFFTVCGAHTWQQYTSLLRTMARQRDFRTCCSSRISNAERLIKPTFLLTLDDASWTCLFQFRSLVMMIPRSFWLIVVLTGELRSSYWTLLSSYWLGLLLISRTPHYNNNNNKLYFNRLAWSAIYISCYKSRICVQYKVKNLR